MNGPSCRERLSRQSPLTLGSAAGTLGRVDCQSPVSLVRQPAARPFWGTLLGWLALLTLTAVGQEKVVVNCAQPADPPLVRKFGVANSCSVSLERYRRDFGALAALKPAALRVELGWGFAKPGWSKPLVGGSAGNVQYVWEEVDELARLCEGQGVDFGVSYCYTPQVFERDGWYSPPGSMRQWANAAKEYAYHYRIAAQPIAAHEIWNRSDSSIFFNATRGNYFRLYKETVLSLREGDPDAFVGGPVICQQGEWVAPFLAYVEFEKLPLDFFSFLAIAPGDESQTWGNVAKRVADIRKGLTDSRNLGMTEIRLNAFNPLAKAQFRPGAGVAQPALATEMLNYLEVFLRYPDLTLVNWSQFMDSGITNDSQGLLDFEGNPRPAFGALAMYADLPVDRVTAAAPEPVHVLAGSDAGRVGALLWNPSSTNVSLTVDFEALPFSARMLEIHRVDAANPVKLVRTGDWELQAQEIKALTGNTAEWTGEIPAQGIVYLRVAGSTPAALANRPTGTRITRLHRWFRDRYGAAYADFESRTLTARLGMGTDVRGTAIIGSDLVNCPTNLAVLVETSGNPRKQDTGSTLAVRVDFFDRGSFIASQLYHAGLYDSVRTEVPAWGTRRAPDKVVQLAAGERWDLDLMAAAPPRWGRRALITFILRDSGPNSRAKFRLVAPAR